MSEYRCGSCLHGWHMPGECGSPSLDRCECGDRWLAEVERAAAEKALRESADAWESGTIEHDEIKYASDGPHAWTDESVVEAVTSSGPTMDWLRRRADSYRKEHDDE